MGKAVWPAESFRVYLAIMFCIDVLLFGQHEDLRASLLVRGIAKGMMIRLMAPAK